MIHSLSKQTSQKPFAKSKGIVNTVSFHPTKPLFYICTDRNVLVYNLQKTDLVQKYQTAARMISTIAIHPKGDNFVLGSYDKKLFWYDQDLGKEAYKKMKYHSKAIRKVAFNKTYPMFSSCADDGSINIFHGKVFEDLVTNPLIVPVKVLKGHTVKSGYGVMDCQWHPKQPWIYSAGADGSIKLWT